MALRGDLKQVTCSGSRVVNAIRFVEQDPAGNPLACEACLHTLEDLRGEHGVPTHDHPGKVDVGRQSFFSAALLP